MANFGGLFGINQLKQAWGLKDAWQQTRQTLHRWVHITMVSYGLVQMLSCLQSDVVNALCQHSPWRHESPVTAGQLRKGLAIIFRHVAVRQWWDGKRKKFRPPGRAELADFDSQQEKAA